MLIVDRSPGELGGFFSKVGSAIKTGAGYAKTAVVKPHELAFTKVIIPAHKAALGLVKTAGGAALAPLMSSQLPPAMTEAAPACGFFQKLSRFFGGNPPCE